MKIRNEKGFSLLEVVVSMMIFSIVVPGVMTMFIAAKQYNKRAEYKLQAYKQAVAVSEKLRYFVSADPNFPQRSGEALSNDVNILHDNAYVTTIMNNQASNIYGADSSSWSYTVDPVSPVAGTTCRAITTNVHWEIL
jgi:prepilin-type N-terminal cleavage/methylation domain-containing protein